jgi:capsular exopolysaccharide synthesis family protein
MTEDERTIDRALRFFRVIAQYWVVVVASTVLLAGMSYGYSKAQPNRYEATASLLFRDPAFDQKLFGSTFFQPSRDPDREALTNTKLVGFDVVAERAARALGPGVTPKQLMSKVDVAGEGRSDVVAVTAHDPSPRTAATIANGWANAYIAVRRDADRGKIAEAQRLIERSIAGLKEGPGSAARRRSLADRQQQLQILASLQTGNAELAQPAQVPRHPDSPMPVRNGVVGGLLGLVLGVFAGLILSRLDRRLKSVEEARRIYGRPLLGIVPASPTIGSVRDAGQLSPRDTETFRMLRANLQYFNLDQEIHSVVVTSAAAGDGKSTIALHLAAASAGAGTSTLLVECDLRRPSLADKLHHDKTFGLTQYLAGGAGFASVIASIPASSAVGDGSPATDLDVAFAGPLPPNPADLLESHRMIEFLEEAEERYELVIIDTSPAIVVSDSIPLLKRASGVLVAVRLGKTTREESEALRARLDNLSIDPLGVVVNDVKAEGDGRGYYYQSSPTQAKSPARA